jgi:hypothetical protein
MGEKKLPARKIQITSGMITAGYASLLSEIPALTEYLSPEDGAKIVRAVFWAMIRARP